MEERVRFPLALWAFRRWRARRVVDPFHRSWQRFLNHSRRGATCWFSQARFLQRLLRNCFSTEGKFVSRASYGTKCTYETCSWAEVHQAMGHVTRSTYSVLLSNIDSDIFCSKTNNTNETMLGKKKKKSCLLLFELHMKQIFRCFPPLPPSPPADAGCRFLQT